jgi:hypothetical protein
MMIFICSPDESQVRGSCQVKPSVVFQRLEIDGIKLEGNFIKKID